MKREVLLSHETLTNESYFYKFNWKKNNSWTSGVCGERWHINAQSWASYHLSSRSHPQHSLSLNKWTADSSQGGLSLDTGVERDWSVRRASTAAVQWKPQIWRNRGTICQEESTKIRHIFEIKTFRVQMIAKKVTRLSLKKSRKQNI